MENKIEFYVYVTTKEDGTLRMVLDEDIYYGETAEFRSHGFRSIGNNPGAPLVFKLPIEHYFDYIAKTIPEQYRTERIQKWIGSEAFSKNQKEIIRCKDCMYYRTHGAFGTPLRKEDRYCGAENFPDEGQKELPEWWFCAGAKRKQNTDQGGDI